MDPIVTSRLSLGSIALHEPSDADVAWAKEQIAALTEEAAQLGNVPAAAAAHHAMGRVFVERLGDRKSAAACFQNAFQLNPRYRPNLESARRLFAAVGQWPRVVALHEKEQALLKDPAQRAESLRAQAQILATRMGEVDEAARRVDEALKLSPEHPALLLQAIDASERKGDRLDTAEMLLRAATVQKDDTHRAQLLRRAVLLLEALHDEAQKHAEQADGKVDSPIAAAATDVTKKSPAELAALLEEALRKLLSADGKEPIGRYALLKLARERGSWEEAQRLLKLHADRSGSPAERAASVRLMLHKVGRAPEALSEVKAGLDDHKKDPALHALRCELEQAQGSPDTARAYNDRAEIALDASEKADCKVAAAARVGDTYEREQLYSEALAANPGDAAAIALHVRAMASRDPGDTADRFVALGEALEGHAPDEAASNFLEAGTWLARAGRDEDAAKLGERVLGLFPDEPGALRLLQRTMPGIGKGQELSTLLDDVAQRLPPHYAVMALLRAAAVVADYPAPEGSDESHSGQARALALVKRAADLSHELPGIGRGLETWFFLAMRAADRKELSVILEERAAGLEASSATEAAEYLLEAAEMARAEKQDARAAELLRKARALEVQVAQPGEDGEPVISFNAAAARKGLLALPGLPADERIALLVEEAKGADTERAAALHAERAALLHTAGRLDEAAAACAQSLALGGVDLAVLRRLSRIQEQRGDGAALLEVRLQIAHALADGEGKADALCRAAEAAEWRCDDAARAEELYSEAVQQHASASALANLARLRAWSGEWAAAAGAFVELADKAQKAQRIEALRSAAALFAHRLGQRDKAVELYRKLLVDEPTDIEASADLLALLDPDHSVEGRRERAELRARLASRCQDPRVSAMLRAEIAEDRFASGDRDQGLVEYRRALALNPQDRLSLDLVEEALRASGQQELLASHLDFRVAYADEETRAALALQQAELLSDAGQLEKAAAAYRTAMGSEELALTAIRGARKLAEKMGDKREQSRLLAKEGGLARSHDAAAQAFVAAAQIAEELGDADEARQHFASAIERDPSQAVAQQHLEKLHAGHLLELCELYEKIGSNHAEPKLAAVAWAQSARLRLHEMKDPAQAYVAAGRALKLDGECSAALEARADAGAQAGREKEALEALQRRMAQPASPAQLSAWHVLAGKLHLALGEPDKGLPLLGDAWLETDLPMLAKGAKAIADLKGPEWAALLYRRLSDGFRVGDTEPLPGEEKKPVATRAELTDWEFALGQASEAIQDREAALDAFRRTVTYDPHHKPAHRRVVELAAEPQPEEALASFRALVELGDVDAPLLHAAFLLHKKLGHTEQAFCTAAALVGLEQALPEEKALYEAEMQKPLPAELPRLADGALDRAPILAAGDEGSARELLALVAPELPQMLPPDLTGKADRVKGDNPVRRVCNALSRALGAPEPQLFLPKGQPAIVSPVATEPPGLLVGAEVPRKYPARHQRFLYGRALAHIRRGTHPLSELPPARLGQLLAELARASAKSDAEGLPPPDADLAARVADVLKPVVELQEDGGAKDVDPKERIAPAAQRFLQEVPASWEPLGLAMRETAERAAMVICGDPAAAIAVVAGECGGTLDKPEVAQLVRFALTDEYAQLRAR